MAWFDFLSADDEKKDELGMTQYDRQQPVWSGLIKAGLLGIAGGQDLAPAQRAQMIAQMGGAVAEIPEQQRAARAAEAQAMLRKQQVVEGKDKLAQREKVRALASTPEFQNDLKNLPPHIQQIVGLQIQAGDMDAVSRTIANANAVARQEKTDALAQKREDRIAANETTEEQRKQAEFKWKQEEAARKAKAKEDELKGLGNTYEARMQATLNRVKEDPSFVNHPDYATAYYHLSKTRPQIYQGQVIGEYTPRDDIGDFPKPPSNPMPGSPNAATPPKPPPADLKAGGPAINNGDGTWSWIDANDPDHVKTEGDQGGVRITDKQGRFIGKEDPKPIPDSALVELAQQKGTRDQMKLAAATFLAEWKKAEGSDRLKALTGANTPLNAAWTRMSMIAKGKALFELGVLNQGDLPQLQKAIADPSSLKSVFSTEQQVENDANALLGLMDAKIGGTEKALQEGRLRRPKGGSGGGSTGPVEYEPDPDNPGKFRKKK